MPLAPAVVKILFDWTQTHTHAHTQPTHSLVDLCHLIFQKRKRERERETNQPAQVGGSTSIRSIACYEFTSRLFSMPHSFSHKGPYSLGI